MKGVVFTGNCGLEIRDFPDPTPGDDEVVLEIKGSGMCGTDLHVYRSPDAGGGGGRFIAGHEPCGVVVARGRAVPERMAPTDARVMVHHYDGCRVCDNCQTGWTQLCDEGSVVYGRTGHGAHARYMKVPVRTLVPLPEQLSFAEGAAISCGTGTAYGAIRRMHMEGGTNVVVSGQGPVGLSATMLGATMGARVIAVDVVADRLARAREFGADATIDASAGDVVAQVKDMTHGKGADYVIECSGIPDAAVAAVRSARTWGTVAFVGMGKPAMIDITADVIRRQLTLVGSWTFSATGQGECARFCADRKLPVEKLFTHRFALADAVEAYKLFNTQTTGKGVIIPS
ncbi:MAG: zinc-binding dehydrogenase [Hyphomicrobiaceae bacterium]